VTTSSKLLLRAILAACALLVAVGVPSAPAAVKAAPCWKALLNDWYDGRIDNIYPIPCYRQAIDHLPTDIKQYSNASDEIERALQAAIAHQKNPNSPVKAVTDPNAPQIVTSASPGRSKPKGAVVNVIDSSSPGGATSFPLPLLILGGLAIVLLAAGIVGLMVRRRSGGDSGAT
jgi:hypothetical protein